MYRSILNYLAPPMGELAKISDFWLRGKGKFLHYLCFSSTSPSPSHLAVCHLPQGGRQGGFAATGLQTEI